VTVPIGPQLQSRLESKITLVNHARTNIWL
jgi:hypothetical protein